MTIDDRFIREAECKLISGGLSRTTRWRMERKGEFPKRRSISPGLKAWLYSELMAWVESRKQGIAAALILMLASFLGNGVAENESTGALWAFVFAIESNGEVAIAGDESSFNHRDTT